MGPHPWMAERQGYDIIASGMELITYSLLYVYFGRIYPLPLPRIPSELTLLPKGGSAIFKRAKVTSRHYFLDDSPLLPRIPSVRASYLSNHPAPGQASQF
jgi:hypothetical protein